MRFIGLARLINRVFLQIFYLTIMTIQDNKVFMFREIK